jgi:hypothetical protein
MCTCSEKQLRFLFKSVFLKGDIVANERMHLFPPDQISSTPAKSATSTYIQEAVRACRRVTLPDLRLDLPKPWVHACISLLYGKTDVRTHRL